MRIYKMLLQSGLVLMGLLFWSSTAEAVFGAGIRGGVQARGGTLIVFGVQASKPLIPLVTARPTFVMAKGSGLTIFNPNLDLIVDLKKGIGPKAYAGVGVGLAAARNKNNFNESKASYNVLGGVRFGLGPTLQGFVEVKGVFIQSGNLQPSSAVRILGGFSFSL